MMMMMMEKEDGATRKGPWTEEEDAQLVFYVKLFGDRRWDFIAKVSGLKVAGDMRNRTGKSCRLRWVNYLHPGLKRGKMAPHEERLVLELHSKWGNRWSRIARKIPGRTDNEIKNYWRTHMRKKAQEKKKAAGLPQSSSSSASISSSSSSSSTATAAEGRSFYDTGGIDFAVAGTRESKTKTAAAEVDEGGKVYSMDEIWKDIELSEESSNFTTQPISSPMWDFCPNTDSLWCVDEEASKIMHTTHYYNSFPFHNNHMTG